MLTSLSLREFAEGLAAGTPVPGGGSAAAVAGVLAAALASMVCQFTVGRRRFETVDSEMRALLSRSDTIRAELLGLVEADTRAYEAVRAAQALPKDSPARAEERERQIQAALAEAIRVPLRAAVLAADVLALCQPIAERGNPRLISDAGVAAILAEAALQSSAVNVRANYPALRDLRLRDDSQAALAKLMSASREVRGKVLALVDSRIA